MPFRTIKAEWLKVIQLFVVFQFSRLRELDEILTLAIVAVCASRAAVKSAISCWMASKVMAGVLDVDDPFEEAFLSTKDNALRGYGMIHEDGDNDAMMEMMMKER
ncbi:hypothetical protein Tco_1334768 [Tanacetum coccineum]